MKFCDYGCDQEAQHQLKNGKWCCGQHVSSCPETKKKKSIKMKSLRKDPTSKYNMISYKEKQSNIMKKAWQDLNSIYNSSSCKEKIINSLKFTINQIKKTHPFFSKIEEIRYNPDKANEIQVHCKNHNCRNSKEKDGWFTPTHNQFRERIRQLENKDGSGGCYFYCSQYCKDNCPLYNLYGDPLKDNTNPYTYQENQLWRQVVLKEDKGLCQYCGATATDVHHIKPVKTHPHLALDPDNGISFCEKCHYKIGHKTGSECSTGNLAKIIHQGCNLGGQL